jgi:hypothetical protein
MKENQTSFFEFAGVKSDGVASAKVDDETLQSKVDIKFLAPIHSSLVGCAKLKK